MKQAIEILRELEHGKKDNEREQQIEAIIDILNISNKEKDKYIELSKKLKSLYYIQIKYPDTDYAKNAQELYNSIIKRRSQKNNFHSEDELEYIRLFEEGREKANSYFTSQ